jgi:hypothetical protein
MKKISAETQAKVARCIPVIVNKIVGHVGDDVVFVLYKAAFCSNLNISQVVADYKRGGNIGSDVLVTTLNRPGVVDAVTGRPTKRLVVATVPLTDGWLTVIGGHPSPGDCVVQIIQDEDLDNYDAMLDGEPYISGHIQFNPSTESVHNSSGKSEDPS